MISIMKTALPVPGTCPNANPVVVCAADDGFAMQLAVTVASVLANLDPSRKLELYILDGGISASNRERLSQSLPANRVSVHWIQPDIRLFEGLPPVGDHDHVTISTYFRLLIPQALPDTVKKVIYLDCDILVLKDLGVLWDSSLQGWLCLAVQDTAAPYMDAVAGMGAIYPKCATAVAARCPIENYRQLGILPSAKYFNSGVLVIDLVKWRTENLTRQFRQCLDDNKEYVLWWDQYVLNVVLAGKWGELDPDWNLQTSLYSYSSPDSTPMGSAAYVKVLAAPRIVHFSSPIKPWHHSNHHPYRELFFQYLDKTAWAGWRPTPPPSVGIVTRTKNRPILLRRAIESVLAQSYEEWVMVIVNDAGDRKPVDELVERYASQARERIRVIHVEKSCGMEAATNCGLRALSTEYLTIHDDDDSWAPDFLRVMVAELERACGRYPSVRGVVCLSNAVSERIEDNMVTIKSVVPYKYQPEAREGLVPLDAMLVVNQFPPIQFLYKTEVINQIGMWREDAAPLADWDFHVRFLRKYDIYVVPQFLAFYHHRISDRVSVYGNTVIAGQSRHYLMTQLLRNEWLRKDLDDSGTGLGVMGCLLAQNKMINSRLDHLLPRLESMDEQLMEIYKLSQRTMETRIRKFVRVGKNWYCSKQRLHLAKRFAQVALTSGIREALRQTMAIYRRSNR